VEIHHSVCKGLLGGGGMERQIPRPEPGGRLGFFLFSMGKFIGTYVPGSFNEKSG